MAATEVFSSEQGSEVLALAEARYVLAVLLLASMVLVLVATVLVALDWRRGALVALGCYGLGVSVLQLGHAWFFGLAIAAVAGGALIFSCVRRAVAPHREPLLKPGLPRRGADAATVP